MQYAFQGFNATYELKLYLSLFPQGDDRSQGEPLLPDIQRARDELHPQGAVRRGQEEDARARDRLQDRRQAENRYHIYKIWNTI